MAPYKIFGVEAPLRHEGELAHPRRLRPVVEEERPRIPSHAYLLPASRPARHTSSHGHERLRHNIRLKSAMTVGGWRCAVSPFFFFSVSLVVLSQSPAAGLRGCQHGHAGRREAAGRGAQSPTIGVAVDAVNHVGVVPRRARSRRRPQSGGPRRGRPGRAAREGAPGSASAATITEGAIFLADAGFFYAPGHRVEVEREADGRHRRVEAREQVVVAAAGADGLARARARGGGRSRPCSRRSRAPRRGRGAARGELGDRRGAPRPRARASSRSGASAGVPASSGSARANTASPRGRPAPPPCRSGSARARARSRRRARARATSAAMRARVLLRERLADLGARARAGAASRSARAIAACPRSSTKLVEARRARTDRRGEAEDLEVARRWPSRARRRARRRPAAPAGGDARGPAGGGRSCPRSRAGSGRGSRARRVATMRAICGVMSGRSAATSPDSGSTKRSTSDGSSVPSPRSSTSADPQLHVLNSPSRRSPWSVSSSWSIRPLDREVIDEVGDLEQPDGRLVRGPQHQLLARGLQRRVRLDEHPQARRVDEAELRHVQHDTRDGPAVDPSSTSCSSRGEVCGSSSPTSRIADWSRARRS